MEGSLDVATIVLMILRWFHVIFGIVWIGMLYFFNFVNVPFAKTMDANTKKLVVPQLMPRALWWFRWAAMITFITGWVYITGKMHLSHMTMNDFFSSTWGQWIGLGALLASIMWFNVWFIIWPSQKKIITWIRKGESPAEMAGLVKKAFMASRLNTYLSLPMLFCMSGASHFPQFDLVTVSIVVVVSVVLMYHLLEKVAPKAGANF